MPRYTPAMISVTPISRPRPRPVIANLPSCAECRARPRDHGAAFGWEFGCALGWAAARCLTTCTRAPACRALALCSTTVSPACSPASTCTLPCRSLRPSVTGAKRSPICRALPHAALQPLALHGGQGNHRRGRQGRGVQRYLGQFARGGQGGGHLGEGHLASSSSVTLSACGSTRTTRPGSGASPRERKRMLAGKPAASPHGGALVQAQMNPHAAGHHQLQHGLPGHHGAARLHRAGGDDGRLRRNQLQMLALGAQGGHLGAGALQFLVGGGQGGLGHIALWRLRCRLSALVAWAWASWA